VFSKLAIKDLMNQYTLVQLYTDVVPAYFEPTTSAAENLKLLHTRFGTAQLPTYVILKPRGNGQYEEVSRYDEGKINNVAGFADFLQKSLLGNGSGSKVVAAGP
jgi:hypothetical protein